MAKLNDKTETTKKIIHLMVTTLCTRNCKHCCNKQYDLNDIPCITDEELKEAEILCLTGGEPFQFTDPCEIAAYYKHKYKNIESVYVYTNVLELSQYLRFNPLHHIDGLSVSIKTKTDADIFDKYIKNDEEVLYLPSNRLYIFDNLYDGAAEGFEIFQRNWQEDFTPADDSIFRRI